MILLQLGMLAYQVENNESQMMGIKKKEYLRVLSNIVKESQQTQVRRCIEMIPLLCLRTVLQGRVPRKDGPNGLLL